ncbi:hypothetical protein F7725_014936 [Dissostichus mawsoni]|uniref:Uncharacterized protein n=1 Tax=Dissostichus mawsoni TaxID=36200 RepID=A0A7J5YI51_DISMA|nr:hypothetical protein F7725_014936 [Dissostichus mawsoni]
MKGATFFKKAFMLMGSQLNLPLADSKQVIQPDVMVMNLKHHHVILLGVETFVSVGQRRMKPSNILLCRSKVLGPNPNYPFTTTRVKLSPSPSDRPNHPFTTTRVIAQYKVPF